jgi:scyllo-inositol 2-dehydrogenase (NADP+)
LENKIINVALCSFGMSGWVFQAPFISQHKGFNLVAVWERTNNTASQKYPTIKTYRTLEALLKDETIEVVVVNTPSVTHFEYAKQCLLANKNVIVEKPFTATVTQAKELISIASQKKLLLSVYQNRRFDSDFKTIKKILDAKLLGNVVEAEFHYDRFDANLSPKVHKETPSLGVGVVYDLGAHLIDQALQLFGMPNAVFADIFAMRPISKVDDYFELLLYYPTLRVRLKASYQTREALPGYVIHGSKGSFIKHKTDVQETDLIACKIPNRTDWGTEPDNQKGLLHTEKDGEIVREYITSEQGNYFEYYDSIYDSLVNAKPLQITAQQGMQVIQIIEAAYKSNVEKKVIEIE